MRKHPGGPSDVEIPSARSPKASILGKVSVFTDKTIGVFTIINIPLKL
jgi:hypothetical protein